MRFKKAYIEITNVCNLSCSFCPKTSRAADFMKPEIFERKIKEIKAYTQYVYFHVLGEPLLHPEIGFFLDLCGEQGLRVNITTNGTLIDKLTKTLLEKKALRQVNFSLHSFEANLHRYTIDNYLDKVFTFIREARKDTGLLISLRLWNLRENSGNPGNKYILESIQKEFSLPYAIEDELTPCKGVKIADHVFLNQASSFRWPDLQDENTSTKGFCYGLRDQIAILVDGTVVPCCLDSEGLIRLGNIHQKPFSEILESDRAKSIYEGFSRRNVVEPLCKKCTYRLRFSSKP